MAKYNKNQIGMNELKLTSIDCFQLKKSVDERGANAHVGYYLNKFYAEKASKNIGFYEDGEIIPVKLFTDGKNLYKLETLNEEFKDKNLNVNEDIIKSIKYKLTDEELKALNLL